MNEPIEYIFELKSGTQVRIMVRDSKKLFEDLSKAIIPGVLRNMYAEGGYLFCIEEIAAIYPRSMIIQDGAPDDG